MQKALSILFLCLYLLGMLRPVAPLIEYELHKDYIAEFLCINKNEPIMACHGQCHLKKELAKAQQEEHSTTENPRIKIEDYPVTWWNIENLQTTFISQGISQNTFYSNHYQFLFKTAIFRPPISFC